MLEIADVAGSGDLPRASLPYWVQCLDSAAVATANAALKSVRHTDVRSYRGFSRKTNCTIWCADRRYAIRV